MTEMALASAQGLEGASGSSDAPSPAGEEEAATDAGAEAEAAEEEAAAEAEELLEIARVAPSSVAGKITVWNGTLSFPMNCTSSTSVPSRGLHHASQCFVKVAVMEM